MNRPRTSDRLRRARRAAAVLAACLVATLRSAPAGAGTHAPFAARAGVEQAAAAAQVWAHDAMLVYVENDEDVDDAGGAARWGYLFYSAARQQSRAYSVRDGRIVAADDLGMKFEAPPLAPQWIDSAAALQAADAHGGRAYCRAHAGRASALVLARGLFDDADPDRTTWTVIYTSAGEPSLFVVVDAAQGRVCRSWRG